MQEEPSQQLPRCQSAKQHPGGGSADVEVTNDVSFAAVLLLLLLALVLDVALVLLVEENLRFESLPPVST